MVLNFVIPQKPEFLVNPREDDSRFWIQRDVDSEVQTVSDARDILKRLSKVAVKDMSTENVAVMWFCLLYSGYEIKATVSQLEKDIGRISKECRNKDVTPEQAKNLGIGYKFILFFAVWALQKVQTTLEGERQESKKNPKKRKEDPAEEPLDKKTLAARDVLLEQLVA